jgi:hypothetical protein
MHKSLILAVPFIFLMTTGCTMFSAWKSIPPPGGCDQCHTVPISSNWQVAYKAPVLSSERNPNQPYFQTEQYTMPQTGKPESSLETRKVEELKCFECHKSPSPAHKGRKGRFHHGL